MKSGRFVGYTFADNVSRWSGVVGEDSVPFFVLYIRNPLSMGIGMRNIRVNVKGAMGWVGMIR
jgi:hypothetical protein